MEVIFQEIRKQFEEIGNALKVIQQVGRTQLLDVSQIAPTLAAVSNSFIQASRKIEECTKIDFNVLKKNLTGWIETLETAGDKTSKSLVILVNIGWPPHGELTVRQLGYIADVYEKQKIEAVKQKIEQYFLKRFGEKEIRQMLGGWKRKAWLEKRVPIFEEALQAHFERKYFLSVSALLPQIEGIIADGFHHQGKMNGEKLKEYYETLLNSKGKFPLDTAILEFLFLYVLVGFEHGTLPQSSISRHAILHGGDISYGIAANSLKCIFLFDYLQGKLSERRNNLAEKGVKPKNKESL